MTSTATPPASTARTEERAFLGSVTSPSSIALIGASDDPTKPTSRPLRFLSEAGYIGRLLVINPRRDTVDGHRAYDSVRDLPIVPEHALIMTPAATVPDLVAECAEAGVRVVSILSDGFAESGPEGAALQERIIALARETGIRIIGPNSIGLVNVRDGIPMTGNAVFGSLEPQAGGSFLISQSGSMIGGLVSRGVAAGTHFSSVVSSGGEIDVTAPELGLAALEDPATTEVLLFLEHIQDPVGMAELGRRAAEVGKPVIAFKLGRSAEASELTVSHTGALAGEDELTDRLLVENGIARVTTLSGLLTAGPLLSRLPMRRPGERPLRVGVVTTTGGAAAMVVDELATRGVEVGIARDATVAALAERGLDVHAGRIIDLTLAGAAPEKVAAAVEVLGAAEEFDSLIVVLGSSARLAPEASTSALIAAQRTATRPVSVFLAPEAPKARDLLQDAGVTVFTQPEVAGDVYAAASRRSVPRPPRPAPPAQTAPEAAAESAPGAPSAGMDRTRVLDEVASYERMRVLGVAPPSYTVLDVSVDGEVSGAYDAVQYPAVVKILDQRIAHKSDIGGVILSIRDQEAAAEAAALVARRADAHLGDMAPRRALLQTMSTGGLGELLVGYRNDAHVGPIVMLAAGGVEAELYRDRAVRLAPVDRSGAQEMLDEVAAVQLLDGYRGAEKGDLDGVADLVVAFSRLADDPSVLEAEINPVLVGADSVVPTDCLVREVVGEGADGATARSRTGARAEEEAQ